MTGPAEQQRLRDLAWLRRVRDRMDRDFDQPLDVEALARGAHMSAGHLSRQFKAAYGETPYAYLMTRRIERAMALLRDSDLTVTEVCFKVGCSSLGTFSTRFTELVGMPPSEYRQKAAGAPPAVDPGITDDERRTITEMMAKGTYGFLLLATKDLEATFDRIQASGAEVVQEPIEQDYGVRDIAVRDPAGNMIRIQERR